MLRAIRDYEQDDQGDWVAILECGHRQHVRHDPPFIDRPWVLTPEGRASRLGAKLRCPECAASTPPAPRAPSGCP